MISMFSLCSLFSLKSLEPLLAMVPKLFSSSSSVIPIPLSLIVKVLFSLSGVIWILNLEVSTLISLSVNDI